MARSFTELRSTYFDAMRGQRDEVFGPRAEAKRRLAAREITERDLGDITIQTEPTRRRYAAVIDGIGTELDAGREQPDIRTGVLRLIGQHATEVAQQEAILASGTAPEQEAANARLRLLSWRERNDPFLITARKLVDALGPDSGVLVGTVLPDSVGAGVLEQQEEENRLKNCQFVVFDEQLTALEAYLAVRAENTTENRRAFGKALAGLQHRDEQGQIVPITHIGMALRVLTDNAVRMLEERTNFNRNKRHFPKPGEEAADASKRHAWAPVTEREQAVWNGIVQLTDPKGQYQHQIVIDRKFGAEYRAWYRDEEHQGANRVDVRAAFYEGKQLSRRARRRAATNGDAPLSAQPERAQADPHLTDDEAFAFIAMLTQAHGTNIFLPGETTPHMQFTLQPELMNDCLGFTRRYIEQRRRMADSVLMANRASAIGKLRAILEDDSMIETQQTSLHADAETVAPTDVLQYILVSAQAIQNDGMVGFLPDLLDQLFVNNEATYTVQRTSNDPFDYQATGLESGKRWDAPEAFAQALANGSH